METVNRKFIMKGCSSDSPQRLHNIDELYELVKGIGFLPLFANAIPGFSVEERTTPKSWWTGDTETDPWEWRQIASRHPDIAYGKFFDKKAGFVSKEWFPSFANYRRNGYDFEALFEDELASYRDKKIMDALCLDDEAVGKEIMSNELKEMAGFGKRKDGSAGEKNFDGTLTGLQMQTYIIVSDFRQRKNRKGQGYGWNIAVFETPETKWGYDFVSSRYCEEPSVSWNSIEAQIKGVIPEADDTVIWKVLGIRYPGNGASSETVPHQNSKNVVIRAYTRKNITVPPEKMPYPQGLITAIGLEQIFGENKYSELSEDQLKGLEYALSTLKDRDRELILLRYREHYTFNQIGKEIGRSPERVRQVILKSLRKLRHPYRLQYIIEGYDVITERLIRTKKPRDVRIRSGMSDEEIRRILGDDADMNLSEIGLSMRSYNCLTRGGIRNLYELITAVFESPNRLAKLRNMGRKSVMEVLEKLKEYGVEIPDTYDFVYDEKHSYIGTHGIEE